MLKKRFNLIFATTFIVTLLAAGASTGPYIAKVSFAQPTTLPASSSTNASLIQITAGKIQDISFIISNDNAPFTRTHIGGTTADKAGFREYNFIS